MTVYVDASVLLRVALGEPGSLTEWSKIKRAVSSRLLRSECLRSLDRLRIQARLPDREVALRRDTILGFLDAIEFVGLNDQVLDRAAQPMPTSLGTLDAIHLATALLWQESEGTNLTMATHDTALGLAAQAHGLKVLGAA